MKFKKLMLVLLLLSGVAQAKEEWQGEFTPPNNSVAAKINRPEIKIIVLASINRGPDGSLDGTITLTGNQLRCYGDAKIEFGRIKGNAVEIKTEPLHIHNCGRFTFKGSVNEDSWVGDVPWNGASNSMTFKRVK
jgi:hypothetical protein